MNCQCSQLPRIFKIETFPNRLIDSLDLLDEKDSGFRQLFICSVCGQHWQLDLIDRLQVNCAIKIDNPNEWRNYDDKPARMHYLFDVRGGPSDEDWLVIAPAACLLKDIVATNLVLSSEPGITAKASRYYAVAMLPGLMISGESTMLWNLMLGGLVGLIVYLAVVWLHTRRCTISQR